MLLVWLKIVHYTNTLTLLLSETITRTTVSELAGRASVITKANEFGLEFSNDDAKELINHVQNSRTCWISI